MSRYLKAFLLSAFLVASLAGCNTRPLSGELSQAKTLLENGELLKAERLIADYLQSGQSTETSRHEIDSIVDMCHRLRMDYTLADTVVLRRLSRYNPAINDAELLRLETEHKLDYCMIDGQKRYFKNCVSNVFRLDSVYAKLKAQKEGVLTDSLSIFRLANTAEVIKKSVAS